MNRITRYLIPVFTVLLLIAYSCKKNNDGSGSGGGAQQDSILANIGTNIILPSYAALKIGAGTLDASTSAFIAAPDADKLSTLQDNFRTAYTTWQSASAYNYFGPASTAQPTLASINVFPTSASRIDSNINVGDFNISTFANTAAKGFPAMDYLLFEADNNMLLAKFTTDAEAGNRKQYLAAVSADIKTEINAVADQWAASGGNYINAFITGKGNSVSSSLGLLINSFDQDFELLKNNRLGVPLGKIPIGTSSPVLPREVEAYYSGTSAHLALADLKTAQGIFLGTQASGNGLGLSSYLNNANAKYNGGQLSDTIRVAFAKAVSDLQAVPDPMSVTIQMSPAQANQAFADCQRLVTLLKTDMPSALGILVTFGDNDGD